MRHPVLTLRAKEGQPPNRHPDVWSSPRTQTRRSSTCLWQEFMDFSVRPGPVSPKVPSRESGSAAESSLRRGWKTPDPACARIRSAPGE